MTTRRSGRWAALGLVISLDAVGLSGCNDRADGAAVGEAIVHAPTIAAAVVDAGANPNDPTRSRLINPVTGRPFNGTVDAATLAEARRIDEAERLYRDGLFDQARSAVDRLIAEGTRQASVFQLKAELTVQAGDVAGTIPWCDRAIAASPRWVEPRILAARCYIQLERYAAADAVFGDLERLFPDGPWGPYGLGVIAVLQGQQDRAAEAFDRALENDPDHEPSLAMRAQLARARGEPERERTLLLRLITLDTGNLAVRERLADIALAAGRIDDARIQLEAVYELQPRPEIAGRLADLARQRGDAAGAEKWQRRTGAGQVETGEPAPVVQ